MDAPGFPMFGRLMPMAWVQAKNVGCPMSGSLALARTIANRYVRLGGTGICGARGREDTGAKRPCGRHQIGRRHRAPRKRGDLRVARACDHLQHARREVRRQYHPWLPSRASAVLSPAAPPLQRSPGVRRRTAVCGQRQHPSGAARPPRRQVAQPPHHDHQSPRRLAGSSRQHGDEAHAMTDYEWCERLYREGGGLPPAATSGRNLAQVVCWRDGK